MNNTKFLLICLLSNKSSIGDGFVDAVNNFPSDFLARSIVVKTHVYGNELFSSDLAGIVNVKINKKDISVSAIIDFFCTILNISKILCGGGIFVYGVSPLNHIMTIFIRAGDRFIWIHDPDIHPGASLSEHVAHGITRMIAYVSKKTILCVASEYLSVRTQLRYRVKSSSIKIINFPYIRSIVFPERNEVDEKYKNCDILFFGRIEPYKGLESLLKAFRILNCEDIRFQAIIAGKGADLNISDLPNVVHENFYIPNEDLHNMIKHCKVCVFPYTSATGTQAIQTALSLGTPCIVTNLPSFKCIARQISGVGLYFIESNDELPSMLKRFLNNDILVDRQKIKTLAQDFFSISIFGRKIADILKNS